MAETRISSNAEVVTAIKAALWDLRLIVKTADEDIDAKILEAEQALRAALVKTKE